MVLVAALLTVAALVALALSLWVTRDRPSNLSDSYRKGGDTTVLDSWASVTDWERIMAESSKASKERRLNGKN